VSSARKALPISICEADLTAPVSYPTMMDVKQAAVSVSSKSSTRQQTVQQEAPQSSSVIGIAAVLSLCIVAGIRVYIRYKKV
jgi:hypothetical protein